MVKVGGAMKYPQLIYGMLGIFVYVGVEVTIDNNFGGTPEKTRLSYCCRA